MHRLRTGELPQSGMRLCPKDQPRRVSTGRSLVCAGRHIRASLRIMPLLLLIAILSSSLGCKPKPPPDPLAGWNKYIISSDGETSTDTSHLPDQAITADYQAYLNSLPADLSYIAKTQALQCFCVDGTGQRAVEVTIQAYGEVWRHVLFYDKNDKRVKAVKYLLGRYQS